MHGVHAVVRGSVAVGQRFHEFGLVRGGTHREVRRRHDPWQLWAWTLAPRVPGEWRPGLVEPEEGELLAKDESGPRRPEWCRLPAGGGGRAGPGGGACCPVVDVGRGSHQKQVHHYEFCRNQSE